MCPEASGAASPVPWGPEKGSGGAGQRSQCSQRSHPGGRHHVHPQKTLFTMPSDQEVIRRPAATPTRPETSGLIACLMDDGKGERKQRRSQSRPIPIDTASNTSAAPGAAFPHPPAPIFLPICQGRRRARKMPEHSPDGDFSKKHKLGKQRLPPPNRCLDKATWDHRLLLAFFIIKTITAQ